LATLGDLTASVQLTRTHVSDFGSVSNQTYALTWQPADWLRLFGSVTTGRTPPAVAFLADPLLETPGVRYFDPLRDETVDVTEISGGNPDLAASRPANRRLSANIKPFKSLPLQFSAEYSAIRNRDVVTALPPASDLILAAFPERFVRDPVTGVLTRVDVRPVQFARETNEQLRYGLNLNLPLGGPRPTAAPAAESPSAGDDDDRSAGSTRAGSARPRLQLNLSHTWTLDSEIVISEGLDPVDLLSRSAIGIGGATRPRHQLDFGLGYAERGLGVRLTGRHRGKSFLRLVDAGDSAVLRFSPLTTFSLRAWAEASRFAPEADWLKRSRLTVSVANLFNQRQRIADSAGLTPLAYQPDYRDPLGRTIEFELRKAF
jgi:outer membrane receptor protein involved in Fe transport